MYQDRLWGSQPLIPKGKRLLVQTLMMQVLLKEELTCLSSLIKHHRKSVLIIAQDIQLDIPNHPRLKIPLTFFTLRGHYTKLRAHLYPPSG